MPAARMTADEHPRALNSGESGPVCPARPATEVADNLRRLMLKMYAENISDDGKVTPQPRRCGSSGPGHSK